MSDREVCQRFYEAEWQRRDQIQAAVNTPVGILTLLGGALVILAQQFEPVSWVWAVLFWVPFAVACSGFCISVYWLTRAFYGHHYNQIPIPSQLVSFHRGLREHYTALGTPHIAEEEFEQYLMERYAESGDKNARTNAERGEFMHRANGALLLALSASVLCAVPYVFAVRMQAQEPQRVEIVNHSFHGGQNGRQATAEAGNYAGGAAETDPAPELGFPNGH